MPKMKKLDKGKTCGFSYELVMATMKPTEFSVDGNGTVFNGCPEYQRPRYGVSNTQKDVTKLFLDGMNPAGELVVHTADGGKTYVIIDGNGRGQAFATAGNANSAIRWRTPMKVFSGLSREDQAKLFLAWNSHDSVKRDDVLAANVYTGLLRPFWNRLQKQADSFRDEDSVIPILLHDDKKMDCLTFGGIAVRLGYAITGRTTKTHVVDVANGVSDEAIAAFARVFRAFASVLPRKTQRRVRKGPVRLLESLDSDVFWNTIVRIAVVHPEIQEEEWRYFFSELAERTDYGIKTYERLRSITGGFKGERNMMDVFARPVTSSGIYCGGLKLGPGKSVVKVEEVYGRSRREMVIPFEIDGRKMDLYTPIGELSA